MVLETKEDFIKFFESLDSDFERRMFIHECKSAMKEGRVIDTEEEIDRFTADEFKVYFPRFNSRLNDEAQKDIDKNYEDSLDDLLEELEQDVDFQLNNISFD